MPDLALPYVLRSPSGSVLAYGRSRERAYKLRPEDVQRVEELSGKTLEYLAEPALLTALSSLGIPPAHPADMESDGLLSEMPADDTPPPAPPNSTSSSRGNPWRILIPIIAGTAVFALLLLLLRSCGGSASPSPTPSTTPTAEVSPPAAPVGSATVTARRDAPVRSGPGDAYPAIGALLAGQTAEALGVSPDGRWVVIRFVAGPGRQGWVSAADTNMENADSLPVVEPPPLPTASATPAPTATASPTRTPTATPIAAPVAIIDGPDQGRVGDQLAFNALRSTAAPGLGLIRFDWRFGDGGTSSGIEVVHLYEAPGSYDVRLTVTDSNGVRAETLKHVEIQPAPATPTLPPPQAVITGPERVLQGQPAIFDGRASSAPAPIVEYRWSFGDGASDQGARVSHAFGTAGSYTVSLVISDQAGRESTASTQVEVVGPTATPPATVAPIAGSRWTLLAYSGAGGEMVPALPGAVVSSNFGSDGVLAGSGGCNDYSAAYTSQASADAIGVGPLNATKTLCSEPVGVMEQEQAFFALLPQAARYRVASGRLEILNDVGAVLLQYLPVAR